MILIRFFKQVHQHILCGATIIILVFVIYWNSLWGPPVFDSQHYLKDSILDAPLQYHIAWGDRPVVNLSFALNHAIGGDNIVGYHIFNTVIHALAALTLYAVLHSTVLILSKNKKWLVHSGNWIAFAIALIWAAHPLNTGSVRYLIQRSESMMGLFYLLTLYCSIRSCQTTRPLWSILWILMATLFCSLGMGAKQVMISAPLLVLLYDRTFLSGSFLKALKEHWCLYGGLATSLGLLFLISKPLFLGESVSCGFGIEGWSWYEYALSQPGVILHYLKLSLWPHPLCLDYMWPPAKTLLQIVPQSFVILALLLATFVGLFKKSWIGFVGAWFFFTLALTSSFIPLLDLAFEHRMYLPLISVVVMVVTGGYRTLKWASAKCQLIYRYRIPVTVSVLALITIGSGIGTIFRNYDYRSNVSTWEDTVKKAPHNPRAHYNYGVALRSKGRIDDAINAYKNSLELSPMFASAHNNLGVMLKEKGEYDKAAIHFELALQFDESDFRSVNNLAFYYLEKGNKYMALNCLRESVDRNPDCMITHFKMAELLAEFNIVDEAIEHYRQVLRIYPEAIGAMNNLALLLQKKGEIDKAAGLCRNALVLRPNSVLVHNTLGGILLQTGDHEDAIEHFNKAVELAPNFAEAHSNLGLSFCKQGKYVKAESYFERAHDLAPTDVKLRINYSDAMFQQKQYNKAIDGYLKLLELEHRNSTVLYQLAKSYLSLGENLQAEYYIDEAARIDSETAEQHYEQAKEYLNKNDFDMAIIHLGLGLRSAPESREILLELAWILSVHPDPKYRDAKGAIKFANNALKVSDSNDPVSLKVLAAAYASDDNFDKAVELAHEAIKYAEKNNKEDFTNGILEMVKVFEEKRPYRQGNNDGSTPTTEPKEALSEMLF